MTRHCFVVFTLCAIALALAPTSVTAQQFALSTPFNTVNDSFFERIGMGFGFQLQGANPATGRGVVGLLPGGQINPSGGIVFSQGGANSALPQFGGHDPNNDANVGFGILKGGNGLFFNLTAGQGNTRTNTNQTPVIVLPNGVQGSVSDSSQTPFVTSIIPVVGSGFGPSDFGLGGSGGVRWVSPLADRMERFHELQRQRSGNSAARAAVAAAELGNENLSREDKLSLKADASRGSSAGHGDLSVAEIKSQQAAAESAKQQELQGLIERAKGAEEAGKANVAKIYYRQALARASGDVRDEIQSKLQTLGK